MTKLTEENEMNKINNRNESDCGVGPVAYWLRLPEELSGIHDTFHLSNLKKCLADASLHMPLDEIKVDKTLHFVEEPVENSNREVKRFLRSFLDDGQGSGSWMFLFVGAVMPLCVPFCGRDTEDKSISINCLVMIVMKPFGEIRYEIFPKGGVTMQNHDLSRVMTLGELGEIIREVFVKLLLDSFGKLSIRVYEDELKRSLGSNFASQNLAFLSSENTSSTNEVSTANGDFRVSIAGGINQVLSTPCAHDGILLENANSEGIKGEDLMVTMAEYPKGIAENMLVCIGKFVFLVHFIILDMPEDIKVPLILGRPFLSIAHAMIDVFKRKITLRVEEEKIIFKSVKPASSLIKRVYMLSLRERMELDLEARLMGETLVLNRSLDPFFEDYIELNDLNVPLELRRNQVDDLMPTIEEDFAVLENMDAYRDEGMRNVIFGEPFLREVSINAKRFEGMIIIAKEKPSKNKKPGQRWKEREKEQKTKGKGTFIFKPSLNSYKLITPLALLTINV
ncbi:putative reverse transcriptase domain-containing protein [Tanacetum coccineum]